MKNSKKFIATAAAIVLAACAAAPMAMTASAASITIDGISTEIKHTFEVYQIFTGDVEGNTLNNIVWGSGVATYDGAGVTAGAAVPTTTVQEIAGTTLATDAMAKIVLSETFTTMESAAGVATLTELSAGYYFVKDVTALGGQHDANSAWILQVAGDATVTVKSAVPTVDKQIHDEAADAEAGATEGWGESADHAINESFQFKLTATIPGDADYAFYEKYKVVFNDTMSEGVTFESIASVEVNGTSVSEGGYTVNGVAAGEAGKTWTLTIDDIKDSLSVTPGTDVTVEVIYNAHLNENAKKFTGSVEGGNTSSVNYNQVFLEYSNNPDAEGTLGKTPTDTVWAFTYTVENLKTDQNSNPLAGATFQLRTAADDASTAIKLIDNGEGIFTVDDQATGSLTDMVTLENGKLNIEGLDAGTYYLVETAAPTNYKLCKPVQITIGADHVETSDDTVNMTLNGNTTGNTIINNYSSTLPSTGGIGTTIFLLVGGGMVGVSGIYLVSKKRAKNEEEK